MTEPSPLRPAIVWALSSSVILSTLTATTFSDVTSTVGLAAYRATSGDFHGPGAVFTDLNNDGWPDLYLMKDGAANDLYLNVAATGGGREFQLQDASTLGINHSDPSTGAVAADYDNDGDLDLFVTNTEADDRLYRNDLIGLGAFGFTDVTATAGVGGSASPSLAAAWADPDRDGDLDLYVGNHDADGSDGLTGHRDYYYRNNGNGTFTNMSLVTDRGTPSSLPGATLGPTGYEDPPGPPPGTVRYEDCNACLFLDINNDGWQDLWVVNKSDNPSAIDMLYLNQGNSAAGVWQGFITTTYDIPGFSSDYGQNPMGISAGDIDNDGDLDIWLSDSITLTGPPDPNQGSDFLITQLLPDGSLSFQQEQLTAPGFGWGVQMADFNNNGFLQLHLANQYPNNNQNPPTLTFAPANDFLYNIGIPTNGPPIYTLSDISASAGVQNNNTNGRGTTVADYNRDGRTDLFVVNLSDGDVFSPGDFDQASVLYENTTTGAGRYLTIKLVGNTNLTGDLKSTRDAIGARVAVRADINNDGFAAPDELVTREVRSGGSTASSTNSLELEFGLAQATTADITITWPSGQVTTETGVSTGVVGTTDGFMTIIEIDTNLDSDNDGMPDIFEEAHTNPVSSTALNPNDDLENGGAGDGLTNLEEYQNGTDPNNPDTDEDGLDDGPETVGVGSRGPTNPALPDTDGDGLTDLAEDNTGIWVSATQTGTNPNDSDSDSDGADDGWETNTGVWVLPFDRGTDPHRPDTDGDGLLDGAEFFETGGPPGTTCSSPHLVDTDGDGFDDPTEVAEGTDACDSADFPAELAHLYRMEDTADDEFDRLNGAVQGAVPFVTGQPGFGKAASFDGNIGNYLNTSGFGIPDGNFSLSTWVSTNDLANLQFIAGTQDGTNPGGRFIRLNSLGSGTANAEYTANGASDSLSGGTITTGGWHHIVQTVSNAGDTPPFLRTHRLYVDGVLRASGSVPDEVGQTTSAAGSEFSIGARNETSGTDSFSGLIDDVAIFGIELTVEQVADVRAGDFSAWNVALTNSDGDALTDPEEFRLGTNPLVADTDNDGVNDDEEVAFGSDPDDINSLPTRSIARVWNEANLGAVRLSFPDPPVHAWNLFHTSVAMWDAWAAYDSTATGYLHREDATDADLAAARQEALSYAAYRLLVRRYLTYKHPLTPQANADQAKQSFDDLMRYLGYDPAVTTTVGNSPAAVGNRIAATIIAWGESDNSNELNGYEDLTYGAVNETLDLRLPGTTLADPNRWQPLEFVLQVSQTGIILDSTVQEFVGSHWGEVTPFALSRPEGATVYLDPGQPHQIGGTGDADYKAGNLEVIRASNQLDPDDGVTIDISPGATGNNTLGQNDGSGHALNPVTNAAYASNMVKRGDFGRVLAEFWADGPDSETPPGHWNTIANEVVEHPLFERKFGGVGVELDPLEWDVKMYFLLNSATHDAAVAAWGCKREYDYIRPISSIRYMGGLGQSSDPGGTAYHVNGLPLEAGLVEIITAQSSASGQRHEELSSHVGEIAIFAWGGEPNDPESEYTGAEWIRAVDWFPYQRDTFVTPAFAGYVSGHSTFSRAAAEVLTRLTGSEFFPGGLGTHTAPIGSLEFEFGPSANIELQWATYYDAADQAGLSRIFGGIHVPVDDGPGRIMGAQCGIGAWDLGVKYFDGSILTENYALSCEEMPNGDYKITWPQRRGLFYFCEGTETLNGYASELAKTRVNSDRGELVISPTATRRFFRVGRSAN